MLLGPSAIGLAAIEVKGGQITVDLYGSVRLKSSYDSQTSQGDLGFYAQPEVNGEKDSQFGLAAKETRFGLNVNGPTGLMVNATGKIEVDFYGTGSPTTAHLRMRLAYLDLGFKQGFSLRGGQDWDTFIVTLPAAITNLSWLRQLRGPRAAITAWISQRMAT